MNKIRVTYLISRIDKVHEFEWLAEYLDKEKFSLSFIILGPKKNTELKLKLDELGVPNIEIYFDTKFDLLGAWVKTKNAMKKWNPDIVHCHLIDATLIGLAAAKWLGIKNRIYTRHHSTFHHVFAPHGVKYDLWANRNVKHIVAVSGMVKRTMVEMEKVDPDKITVIDHGFPASTYGQVPLLEVEELKKKYALTDNYPVVGVVSRYDEWKGVNYIIDAFEKFHREHPKAKLVLANARKGDDVENITKKLSVLPVDSYIEIEFEKNNLALFRTMDMFVHVPIDSTSEAFGQVYVETLAQKVPIIGTLSGVGEQIMHHLENSYVVNYKDSESIYDGMEYVMSHPSEVKKWTESGYQLVSKTFTIDKKIKQIEDLYYELMPERKWVSETVVSKNNDRTVEANSKIEISIGADSKPLIGEPLVTVVIPCYNSSDLILETVNSVISQSYKNIEIIVVNDGSTDNTKEVLESVKHPMFRIVNQDNIGVSEARNHGFKLAKGDFIIFLDADDILGKSYIKSKVKLFLANPDINTVGSIIKVFSKDVQTVIDEQHSVIDNFMDNILLYVEKNSTNPSSYMFRKSFFGESVNPFNTNLASTADRYFLIEFATKAQAMLCTDEDASLYYRSSASSMSGSLTKELLNDNEKFYELLVKYNLISKIHLKKGYFILYRSNFKLRRFFRSATFLLKYLL